MMWKMLGSIQFIVHLSIGSLSLPGNLTYSFEIIADLCNFKLIPIDAILKKVLKLKKAATSETLGYSSNFFESMGLILLLMVLILVLVLIYLLLKKLGTKSEKIKKMALKLKAVLFFKPMLRTMISTYLVIFASSLYSNLKMDFTDATMGT